MKAKYLARMGCAFFCNFLVIIVATLFLIGNRAYAVDYTFSWQASSETISGYKLYYKQGGTAGPPFNGTGASEGSSPIVLDEVTTTTIHGLLAETTYHFALTAYNGTEESGFTDVITVFPADVTTEPLSAAIATSVQSDETPLTVTFDASGSTGNIASYIWAFGDGSTLTNTSETTTHTYSSAATYTIALTVETSDGESASSSTTITIDNISSSSSSDGPTAIIGISQSECTGSCTIQFTGSNSSPTPTKGCTITSYDWNFGDGARSTEASPSHSYSDTGEYITTLEITDSLGASAKASTNITINSSSSSDNQPPQPYLAATPRIGVAPLAVEFDGSSSIDPDGTITSCTLDFGDGTSISGETDTIVSTVHSYPSTGEFTATLTVIDDKDTEASVTKKIQVVTEDEYTTIQQKRKTMFNNIIIFLLND